MQEEWEEEREVSGIAEATAKSHSSLLFARFSLVALFWSETARQTDQPSICSLVVPEHSRTVRYIPVIIGYPCCALTLGNSNNSNQARSACPVKDGDWYLVAII